jgi:aspartate-semialdehyde dehydrogenase
MAVLDSLSISSHPLHSNISFSFGQEFGGGRYIGKEKENHDAPHDADAAEYDEDVHPAFEGAGGDVADCVAEEAADHGCDAVGAVVCFEAEGLFGGGPPHT